MNWKEAIKDLYLNPDNGCWILSWPLTAIFLLIMYVSLFKAGC